MNLFILLVFNVIVSFNTRIKDNNFYLQQTRQICFDATNDFRLAKITYEESLK